MFQPIHDHFEESLWRIRNNRTGKGQGGEEQRPAEGKGKEKGKTKDSKGKVGRAAFDFNFDYRRPFYIKYVKVDNWETHTDIQYEEDYVKTVEEKLWEEAGMDTEEWRQDTVCEKPLKATYEKASLPPRYAKAPLEPIYEKRQRRNRKYKNSLAEKSVRALHESYPEGTLTRRAGRIAQRTRASSVHKPYAPTSAQIQGKPQKQHN